MKTKGRTYIRKPEKSIKCKPKETKMRELVKVVKLRNHTGSNA